MLVRAGNNNSIIGVVQSRARRLVTRIKDTIEYRRKDKQRLRALLIQLDRLTDNTFLDRISGNSNGKK